MTPPSIPRRVMLNGRLLAAADARLSPFGDGFMFGCGVFETIKVVRGEPVFFAEHCARLAHGMQALGLGPAPSTELRARCVAVIAANPTGGDVLKVVVFADAQGTGELILTRASRYTPADYERGFCVRTAPAGSRPHPLAGLKSLNGLAHRQARLAARAAGCDEALWIDPAGAVLEGAASNLFVVRAGHIATPPLASGILPGIVRSLLLAQPALHGTEAPISAPDLMTADEVFLTNSLLGVMPVARIDGHDFDLRNNSVTRTFMAEYRGLEEADLFRPAKNSPPCP